MSKLLPSERLTARKSKSLDEPRHATTPRTTRTSRTSFSDYHHRRASSIPKPPEEAPLFRNDILDRYHSNIPYPSPAGYLFYDVLTGEERWRTSSNISFKTSESAQEADRKVGPSRGSSVKDGMASSISTVLEYPSENTGWNVAWGDASFDSDVESLMDSTKSETPELVTLPPTFLRDCVSNRSPEWRCDLSRVSSAREVSSEDFHRETPEKMDSRQYYTVGHFRRCPQKPVSEDASFVGDASRTELSESLNGGSLDDLSIRAAKSESKTTSEVDEKLEKKAAKEAFKGKKSDNGGCRVARWLGRTFDFSMKAMLIVSCTAAAHMISEHTSRSSIPLETSKIELSDYSSHSLVYSPPMTQSYPLGLVDIDSD